MIQYTELQELFDKTSNRWGPEFQKEMLLEECLELALALQQHLRRTGKVDSNKLSEEIADVYLMIGQVVHSFGLEPRVNFHIDYKVKRLKNRLSEGYQP